LCSNRTSLCYWVWIYRRIFVQAFCRRHLCLKSVPNFRLVYALIIAKFQKLLFLFMLQEAWLRWWSCSHRFLCTAYSMSSLHLRQRDFFQTSPVYTWETWVIQKNGILVLLIVMVLEWPIFLFLTLYLDEFGCLRNGIRKLLTASRPDGSYQTLQKLSTQPQEFEASIEIDKTNILREVQPKYFYLYVLCFVNHRA